MKKKKKKKLQQTPPVSKPITPAPARNPPASIRVKIACVFVLILSCILAYGNTLDFDFVYDDNMVIVENPYVHGIKNFSRAFSDSTLSFLNQNIKMTSNYYRPMLDLTFMFLYEFYGPNPRAFHGYKLFLHIACTLLFFFVSLRILDQRVWQAFLAGLLFASHPMHTESVTWISGLPDVQVTLCALAALLCFITYSDSGKKGYYYFSGFFVFVGLLNKELAVMIVPVLFLYEWAIKKKSNILSLKSLQKYGLYILLGGIYFVMRGWAVGAFAPYSRYVDLTVFQVFLNAVVLMAQYWEKLLFPVTFSAYYEFEPIRFIYEPAFLISLCVVVAMVALSWRLRKSRPVYLFGFWWTFITLLPMLHCQKLGENVFTERYLYLPSVGFCLLLSELCFRAVRRKYQKFVVVFLCGFLLSFYHFQTIRHNKVWKNNLTLWSQTVVDSPSSGIVRSNLGEVLLNQGRVEEAIPHFLKAVELNPEFSHAHNNLGVAFARQGKAREAEFHFSEAVKMDPNNAEAQSNLGNALFEQGKLEEAIDRYSMALKIKPHLSQIQHNRQMAAERLKAEKLTEFFSDEERDIPANESIHYSLGNAFLAKGDIEKAIFHYSEALKINPDLAVVHNSLGNALLRQEKIEEAMKHFSEALRIDPRSAEAHNSMGSALAVQGKFEEARTHYEKALEINPEFTRAFYNLQIVVQQINK